MFDGNQTSFNIIQHRATSCSIVQHRATSCNMVAKWVQHVGLNNVGSCCINMLDPFGRALIFSTALPKFLISNVWTEFPQNISLQKASLGHQVSKGNWELTDQLQTPPTRLPYRPRIRSQSRHFCQWVMLIMPHMLSFEQDNDKKLCTPCKRCLPCCMKILREFYFADWRFIVVCGNKFLRFQMTEISGGN